MRMKSVLDSGLYIAGLRMPQPVFAPPREDDGGGGDDFEDQLEDDSDTDPLLEGHEGEDDESQDEDEISLEGGDFLSKLFSKTKDEEEEDGDDEDEEDAGDSEEDQTAMAEAIKTAVAALSIPEDAIPDNFDPSDSKQLRELLGKTQRDTVQQTMRIMWTPIAAALKQTIVRVRQETRQTVGERITGDSLNNQLVSAIPIYKTPAGKAVVDGVLKQTQKRYKGDTARIVSATKKALIAMGVNIQGGGKESGKPGAKQTVGRRDSMLDLFAPLPVHKRSAKPADRAARRMSK